MGTSRPSNVRDAARRLSEVRRDIGRIKSPLARAQAAESLIRVCQDAVEATAGVRRGAVRQMYEDGWTVTDIATEFGVSRARAHQIINT